VIAAFALPSLGWVTWVYASRIFRDDVLFLKPSGLMLTLRGETKTLLWSDVEKIGYMNGGIMPFVTVVVLKASPTQLPFSVADALTKRDPTKITLPFLWQGMGWSQRGVGKILERYVRDYGATALQLP